MIFCPSIRQAETSHAVPSRLIYVKFVGGHPAGLGKRMLKRAMTFKLKLW